jgi:hypothetical protein
MYCVVIDGNHVFGPFETFEAANKYANCSFACASTQQKSRDGPATDIDDGDDHAFSQKDQRR